MGVPSHWMEIQESYLSMTKSKFVLVALLATLLSPAAAAAQDNSILRGTVLDVSNAVLPGATLTLSGDQVRSRRTAVTDGQGTFVFLGLVPGTYDLEVQMPGFKPLKQAGILLRASQTLELRLSLDLESVTTTVVVRAEAPIVDTGSPTKNYNISGEFMTRLPLNTRQTWEALWTMIPGVGGFPDGANFDPVVNGASAVSNSYTLNGFNIGNAFTNQGWRTQFSTEAIQDVVVKTAGADASTPLAQGGAVNIVTKSGGNEFHGSAGLFAQPKQWNWTNVPGGTSSTLTLYQPDVSAGGPVVLPTFGIGNSQLWTGRNKLWFFTTYRRVITDEGVPRSAAVLARFTQYGLPVPNYDKLERSNRFTGKLTYQVNDQHTVVFNYLNDDSTILNSDSRDASLINSTIDIKEGGPTYQLRWTGNLASNLLWTAQYGKRLVNNDVRLKGGDSPAITLWETTAISGGNRVGSGAVLLYDGNRAGNAQGSYGRRPHEEFTTDVTWLLGGHTVQAGYLNRPATEITTRTIIPTSGTTVLDEVLIGNTRVPFRRFTWDSTDFPSSTRATAQHGFYVQDRFRVNAHLTLNVGVRVDNQKALDAFDRTLLDAWTVNPRVGFAWSVDKAGRNVIRGSWGR